LTNPPFYCYFSLRPEIFSGVHKTQQGERTLNPINICSGGALAALPPRCSINDLTDEELKRMRAVRLHDPVTRASIVIPSKDYGGLYAHCAAILRKYEGYIFAHDLNRIRGLMRRHNVISHEDLFEISARAKALREDGIPPIFPAAGLFGARSSLRSTNPLQVRCLNFVQQRMEKY
jgi:hypothetical protein